MLKSTITFEISSEFNNKIIKVMGIFDAIFGAKVNPQVESFLSEGAKIIDVRTGTEFDGGHSESAVNIPLDLVRQNVDKIKKMNAKIVLVCRSGGRAGQALAILNASGIECVNAGAWQNVK